VPEEKPFKNGFSNPEVQAVLLQELRLIVTADAVRQLPDMKRFEQNALPRMDSGLVDWYRRLARLPNA